MEKKYEITEKQLVFLEDYLKRKYKDISDETRIELIDHLVLDFEATTENGNLSQYLSNELGFIRRFVLDRIKLLNVDYNKDVWQKYFSFFTSLKLFPITLGCFLLIYFLSDNLNDKILWLSFFFSVFGVYGYSLFAQEKNIPKNIRKLPEVQALGKGVTMGIPYLMSMVIMFDETRDFIIQSRIFFTFYWFFAFSLSIASVIVLHKKKSLILEEYKHLLN